MTNKEIIQKLTQLEDDYFSKFRTYELNSYTFVFDVDKRTTLYKFLKYTLNNVIPVHSIKNDVVSILYAITGSILTSENKLYCSDIEVLRKVLGDNIIYGKNKIMGTYVDITDNEADTEYYVFNNLDLENENIEFIKKLLGDQFRVDVNGKVISTFASKLNKDFNFDIAKYSGKPTYKQLERCAKYLLIPDIPIPFEYNTSREYDIYRICEYFGLDSDMKDYITHRILPLK